ncbi:hypothetical protein Vretifemale_12292 [Volvox reticuliferus]|uniref:Uncharacterized protein n=1 Tax=Volvox reticuliferus TaxID=1737510 RepID=A0A8J4CKG5_9CHLO|nr:hypothetical protein Vretifemale_12292 [Volvox reticuliferus]
MGHVHDEHNANTVLLATSADLQQYKGFLKLRGATALYMPLWTDDEIEKCRSQLFPTLDAAMVQTLMSKWGNIPRYVLEKATDGKAQCSLGAAIIVCEWEDILICIGNSGSAQDYFSERLVHFEVVGDQYNEIIMKLASPYVVQEMEIKAGKNLMRQLQNLVRLAIWKPRIFTAAAGVFFESYVDHHLQQGGSFKVRHLCASQIGHAQVTAQHPPDIHNFVTLEEVQQGEDVQQQNVSVYYVPCIHTFPIGDFQRNAVDLRRAKTAASQFIDLNQRLYFTVPDWIFESFKFMDGIPMDIEQWVLEVPWM